MNLWGTGRGEKKRERKKKKKKKKKKKEKKKKKKTPTKSKAGEYMHPRREASVTNLKGQSWQLNMPDLREGGNSTQVRHQITASVLEPR